MKIIYIILIVFLSVSIYGDSFFERSPVDYENGVEDNEIVRLQKKLNEGQLLKFDDEHGYLRAVLKALKISQNTQTLVFSKTSLHRKLISSYSPRALYYNKNTYIGWVNGAKVLEIAVTDKNLGAVFYTLDQRIKDKPVFERDDTCLSCHASSRTKYEPGFFIRSIFPDKTGEIISRAGEERVNHATELGLRWGGWFVTAEEFSVPHRGNAITVETKNDFKLTSIPAKTTDDLKKFFDPDNYLTKTSDIQALMALEHQVEMHNVFNSAKFRIIHSLHNEKVINKALNETGRRDQTKRILSNAADEILEYMLFADEVSLKSVELKGIKSFIKDFKADVPIASSGKSLTDFDFTERISKYPCSWLIYSDSFLGIPKELKELVLQRLKKILTSAELDDKFIHLRKTRSVIHDILMETHAEYKLI